MNTNKTESTFQLGKECRKRCYRIYQVDTRAEEALEKDGTSDKKKHNGVCTNSVSIMTCEYPVLLLGEACSVSSSSELCYFSYLV
jgi:hypothetical protein